jgi:hypothetical protein
MSPVKLNTADQEFVASIMQMVAGEPGVPREKTVALVIAKPHRHVYVFPVQKDLLLIHKTLTCLHPNPCPQIIYLLGPCSKPDCGCGRVWCRLSIPGNDVILQELHDFAFEELESALQATLLQVDFFFNNLEPTMQTLHVISLPR